MVLSDPRPSTHFNMPVDWTGWRSDDRVDDSTMDASHPRSWRTDLISSGVSGGASLVGGLQIMLERSIYHSVVCRLFVPLYYKGG